MKENFELSKKRAEELFDKNIINEIEVGSFKGLQKIHFYLFQDVFDFAGEIRNLDISKGNFRFVSYRYIHDALKEVEKMNEETYENIIEKYIEMNIIHPFREGNGRSMRIWLDLILKKNLNLCVDWSLVKKEDYLSAMERSPINSLEIKTLLESALTKEIDNREVYMKGIQKSYEYEGYYVDLCEYILV